MITSTLGDKSDLSCEDKVPWLYGKPDTLIKLDDDQQLLQNNLTLSPDLTRGDYYIHFSTCKWYVIERKEGRLRFEHKITQIKRYCRSVTP